MCDNRTVIDGGRLVWDCVLPGMLASEIRMRVKAGSRQE